MPAEVVMKASEYDKFVAYTDLMDTEVAAFGYVKDINSQLYVEEIFLCPQTVSGTSVEFMEKGMPWAVEKALEDGRIQDLRFCIHSHVNMNTGFSKDDDEMIEKIRDQGAVGPPWFVSAIMNKKGETNARVDLFRHEGLSSVGHIEIKADLKREYEEADLEQYMEALDEFVEIEKPKPVVVKKGSKGGGKTTSKDGDELEGFPTTEERRVYAAAKQNKWSYRTDTDGSRYYFDDEGTFKGSISYLAFGSEDAEELENPGRQWISASEWDEMTSAERHAFLLEESGGSLGDAYGLPMALPYD